MRYVEFIQSFDRKRFKIYCCLILVLASIGLIIAYSYQQPSIEPKDSQPPTVAKQETTTRMPTINRQHDDRVFKLEDELVKAWPEIFNFSRTQAMIPPSVLLRVMKYSILETSQYDPELVDFVRTLIHKPFPREALNISDPKRTHYSQEDQSIYMDSLLKQKQNGFFIEAGALNGEVYSNSLFFERFRNWTGLLIEPEPHYFRDILAKKRHAYAINCCIAADKPMIAKFKLFSVYTGRISHLSEKYSKYIDSQPQTEIAYIPCFSLNTIMKAIGVTKVDYFSLDVEGGEQPVINSIDYDTLDIGSFSIEWDVHPESKQALIDKLKSKKFELVREHARDIYLKKTEPPVSNNVTKFL